MSDGWRKIERGLFESADGRWRIAKPWKRDHATLHEARVYVEGFDDLAPTA